MIKEFEYEGIWWLPEKPRERINGRLRYTPWEGPVLELSGSLVDSDRIFETLEPKVILGISATGKSITLHECIQTKSNYSDRGFSTSSFVANRLFVGALFDKPEDIRFSSMNVHYSYLDEWVGLSGFDIQERPEQREVTIAYRLPERIEVRIGDGLSISIDFRAEGPYHTRPQKVASVEQTTEMRIETSKQEPLECYTEIMYELQNFLGLGIMEPTYVLHIQGKTDVNKRVFRNIASYPPVEIFFRQLYVPKATKRLSAHNMLYAFRQIADRFESLLKAWFAKAELLKPTRNLYFKTLYNPDTYVEHHFLNLVHAVESFHRSIYGGSYMEKKDYERNVLAPLVTAIPTDIGEALRTSLSYKLKYGNEFSLRKRLQDICDHHRESLNGVIGNACDFIERVICTRNYLIHHDENDKVGAASGTDIYRLAQRLRRVVEVCLLSELGFAETEITKLFSGKRKLP